MAGKVDPKWLLEQTFELIKAYWARRRKPYVQISLALIASGGAILNASWITVALQLIKASSPPSNGDSPWWQDPLIGLGLMVLGIIIFGICYAGDPDRKKSTPPPDSITVSLTPGLTFAQAAQVISTIGKKVVNVDALSDREKKSRVRHQELTATDVPELLLQVRSLSIDVPIRELNISLEHGVIFVRPKDNAK